MAASRIIANAQRFWFAVSHARKTFGWPGALLVASRLVDELSAIGSTGPRLHFADFMTDLWLGVDTRMRRRDDDIDQFAGRPS